LKRSLARALRFVVPRGLGPSLKTFWILNRSYGFWRSVRRGQCVDREGKPVPWLTYPAIDYLRQLDFRDRTVFEFGAGHSTLFWAERAARVVSVESQLDWFDKLDRQVPANVELHFAEEPDDYVGCLARQRGGFDVIVVDGDERRRCCRAALDKLSPGGFVILDNADWYPEEAALLREGDLIEVDFTGFSPQSGYVSTTSLFLHRAFDLAPAGRIQPRPGPGSFETHGNLLRRWGLE
jgi:hypothetical protein